MFKKFLSLFTWWKRGDRGITQKPKSLGFNHNPRPAEPWPNPVGTNRRIKPEVVAPFGTGTPHDRMHDLIAAGKPDALIAIELGVDISAVRNYRHIISARGREAARWAAAEAKVPKMLARGELDEDIAAELGLSLQTVRNIRDAWNRALASSRVYWASPRDTSTNVRVPAALLRRAEKLDETARINETFGKFYDPDVSQSVTAEGCARVRATLDELDRIESQCSAPSRDISSGRGGDFGGAGATGSWDGDRR